MFAVAGFSVSRCFVYILYLMNSIGIDVADLYKHHTVRCLCRFCWHFAFPISLRFSLFLCLFPRLANYYLCSSSLTRLLSLLFILASSIITAPLSSPRLLTLLLFPRFVNYYLYSSISTPPSSPPIPSFLLTPSLRSSLASSFDHLSLRLPPFSCFRGNFIPYQFNCFIFILLLSS